MREKSIYAMYRGDTFLDMGTAEELAKKFNVTPQTVHFYTTPSNWRRVEKGEYEERLIAIKVEGDDDDEN